MIQTVRRASPLALLAITAIVAAGCGTPSTDTSSAVPTCQTCHGGQAGNAAPPRAVTGETATTAIGVGAHQAHLADSEFRKAVACGECHVVPESGTAHANGTVELAFGTLARHGGAPAAWSRASATCSGVYCHGDTLAAGGSYTRPIWNAADPVTMGCGSCHGFPPSNHVASRTDCRTCHPETMLTDTQIDVAGGHHINGVVEKPASLGCNGCHDAPPDNGAHRAHVGFLDVTTLAYGDEWRTEELDPTGAQGTYSFGCGTCHPKDEARHQDGTVDVELTPAAGVAGGLRARNAAGAAYAGGTCSGVYCHSSGQATPTFTASPAWTSGASLGCGGCHGNPPSYPNAGPDGAANSHIFLNFAGHEGGHFAGLPGPTYHRSRHGSPSAFPAGQRAAPLTCQTCHADTVDPANVAAGGFFYLDTSITTRLAGGDQARFGEAAWKDTQCVTCHDGGAGSPPSGTGKVRPARHVNGTREIAFDQRGGADLPAGWYADLGPSAPTRPYFTTGARFPFAYTLPPGAGWDPAAPTGPGTATLSYELGGTAPASYDPANRTCSSVACHLGNAVRWGQKDFEPPNPTCTGCHALQ